MENRLGLFAAGRASPGAASSSKLLACSKEVMAICVDVAEEKYDRNRRVLGMIRSRFGKDSGKAFSVCQLMLSRWMIRRFLCP